jgi:hypothetical protein
MSEEIGCQTGVEGGARMQPPFHFRALKTTAAVIKRVIRSGW